MFHDDIRDMLQEKEQQYGRDGGFFETNTDNYDHAIGEIILKLKEFGRAGTRRLLIKAATWLYLIYEREVRRGSE
jgi:hypothetical protein